MANRSMSAFLLSRIDTARTNLEETRDSSVSASRIMQIFRSALLVGIGYYVGTRIGFYLTPHGQPNSTFWPPNAILLAGLLLAPRRAWWVFLLAVLPAHLLAQLQTGVPFWTSIGWFITNTSEALIGAFLITRFTRGKIFDSARGVVNFVAFGVVIAPLATSFLDAAAVVITGWGHGYWPLEAERFWTNALAELTVVPTIVIWGSNGISWIREASVARRCEAALLALGVVSAPALVFGLRHVSPATMPALLFAPLILLLWATVRFGSGGMSACLLCIALISIWHLMHGTEPFSSASMPENVLSLQILFCIVAVPLLFLSALMRESRRTEDSLRKISGSLINAQEQERHRIGRELHDDINQRLALLAVSLEGMKDTPPVFGTKLKEGITEAHRQILDLTNDVQTLSHDLHSSKVEFLGLPAAARSFCQELSDRQKVDIVFQSSDIPEGLPADISLCLYRVLQEALQNAVKHSGSQQLEVLLTSDAKQVELTVSDSGIGFEPEEAVKGRGVGLVSMSERLNLVGGHLSIDSQSRRGTTIRARVPLKPATKAAGAGNKS